MLKHSLFSTLNSLRGNPKACVYTEPLWGIPYNLYAPYVSVYMLQLGLKDVQIGMLLSFSLAMQVVWGLLGGPITDKMGRRKATFIFDVIAWSVPMLLWAFAQDIRYFLAAAMFNAVWRVTHTSWSCLMVEDAEPDHLVDIYSWVYIAGLLSAFFAPFAGLLINRFELIPTMRGLYLFSFVIMTLKFILLYVYSTETRQGQIRLEETRDQSLFRLIGGYGDVIKQVLRTPATMYTLGILVTMHTASTIGNTFWSILVTQRLQIPDSYLAIYPFARSLVMLFFFFLAMPIIKQMRFRNPMIVGFASLALAQIILITIPERSYLLLLVSTFLEACAYATVSTQIDRMIVVTVNAQERARIMSLLFLVVIIFTTPFGWIAGQLSEISRVLPFVLNIGLYMAGAVLVYLAARSGSDMGKAETKPVEEALGVS
jgi:MFS family permease